MMQLSEIETSNNQSNLTE